MSENDNDRVSRKRYAREQQARNEAESLLEAKSRELFLANAELSKHSETLEKAVYERTRALSIALEQAEAASAARSRFIATMSHEIRTPLAGLLGMIDLLSHDETDEEKCDFLKNAQVSGIALNRIVNDVLDFSKMEAGLFAFENESVDIRALTKSVIILAQTNLKGDGRVIEAQIDPDVPQLFLGDATRIRQVISNLVSNAARYSKRGPIVVRITSSEHAKGALLRMEVEDHGIGVAEDQIENLFKDFSQISNPLTAAAQGTGLGLAISKRIIEGCGGIIDVKSIAGKGTTFWIELPVKVLAVPVVEPNAPAITTSTSNGASLVGQRILLAEDNPINQKLLLTYLKRMEIDVDLAENGRIALEKFSPGKFDLILMDVAMPVMDGLTAIRHIRHRWNPFEIPPIIILTAHVMEAIEDDAALVGVDFVLNKPIRFEHLKSTLGYALAENSQLSKGSPIEMAGGAEAGIPRVAALMPHNVVEDLLATFSVDEFDDLIKSYVAQTRDLMQKILSHHIAAQTDSIRDCAHSLKGSSLLLGFNKIAQVAAEIETSASSIENASLKEKNSIISEQLELIENLI